MDNSFFLAQLDSLIMIFQKMKQQTRYDDFSDIDEDQRQSLITRVFACVHRITGTKSSYSQELQRLIDENVNLNLYVSSIIGVAKALKEDLESGYIKSLSELIHADLFSDFLEQAQFLLENGFKDPAAVLAGSTLESHLKNLADKYSIPIMIDGKSIKADRLNAELAKAKIYSVLDQKNIIAWLDLRNKAAHGNYSEYTNDQVKLLIASIQEFIARHIA